MFFHEPQHSTVKLVTVAGLGTAKYFLSGQDNLKLKFQDIKPRNHVEKHAIKFI